MDPMNPMASMLDPKIAQIYEQASAIRDALRKEVPRPDETDNARRRAEELAAEVVAMPARLRMLVDEGELEEAKREWEMPRRLLLLWREKGQGGRDVQACLDAGDAIIQGEESESSEDSS
jgi:hypothetical protein